MNKIDKEVLRIIIPVIVSCITAYYTVKNYDFIVYFIGKILG